MRDNRWGEIRSTAARGSRALASGTSSDEVLTLIDAAKRRAYQAVNSELVGLYWQIGEHISCKLDSAEWGEGTVEGLAAALAREHPGLRSFSRPNLFRMRQFYETYRGDEKVAPLVRQLPWTHHLIILSQTRLPEERSFYILTTIQQGWTKRELERQIRAQAFRRSMLEPARVSAALPPKAVLREKLHDLYTQLAPEKPPRQTQAEQRRSSTRRPRKRARS